MSGCGVLYPAYEKMLKLLHRSSVLSVMPQSAVFVNSKLIARYFCLCYIKIK